MTQKNLVLAAFIAVSSLGLSSAFSVAPPMTTTTRGYNTVASSSSHYLPASQERLISVSATSGDEETTTTKDDTDTTTTSTSSKDEKKEIYLLDEVDNIFESVDTNGDGKITPDELRNHLVNEMGYTKEYTDYLFESIDTDSNGSISLEELRFAFYNFEALSMYMTFGMGGADITKRAQFKDMAVKSANQYNDGNDDSSKYDKLLLDDLADLIFDMIDTDKSGEISKAELEAHFDSVTEKLSKVKATNQQAKEYVQTVFATLDTDRDGDISREEIRTAFGKYDFKLLARTFGLKVYRQAEV